MKPNRERRREEAGRIASRPVCAFVGEHDCAIGLVEGGEESRCDPDLGRAKSAREGDRRLPGHELNTGLELSRMTSLEPAPFAREGAQLRGGVHGLARDEGREGGEAEERRHGERRVDGTEMRMFAVARAVIARSGQRAHDARKRTQKDAAGGKQDRLAPLHLGPGEERSFATRCPAFSPGTQVTIDPGSGPQTFDLARSYRNFVLYLARKLSPDYLALMVEANLIEANCPARAAELYALYRTLHDEVEVEAELGAAPLLFATLSLPPLLAYDRAACYPSAGFSPCAGAPVPRRFPSALRPALRRTARLSTR